MKAIKRLPEILLGLLLLFLGGVAVRELIKLYGDKGIGAVLVFIGFVGFLILYNFLVSHLTRPREIGSHDFVDPMDLGCDGGSEGGGGGCD